jgi:hypothetical protein
MNKLRNPGPDFWRGLGATVVLPGFVALYVLGVIVALIDETFFGGEWTDQAGGVDPRGSALSWPVGRLRLRLWLLLRAP